MSDEISVQRKSKGQYFFGRSAGLYSNHAIFENAWREERGGQTNNNNFCQKLFKVNSKQLLKLFKFNSRQLFRFLELFKSQILIIISPQLSRINSEQLWSKVPETKPEQESCSKTTRTTFRVVQS